MTMKLESDLFIACMITGRIGEHKILLPIYQNYNKFERESRHHWYVFMKNNNNYSAKCTTTLPAHESTVHLHGYDITTVLLHCPIASMCALC